MSNYIVFAAFAGHAQGLNLLSSSFLLLVTDIYASEVRMMYMESVSRAFPAESVGQDLL